MIGLGKKYLVHIIKTTFGTYEKCLEFMKKNKPTTNKKWFELRPLPNIKNKTCDQYNCSLVEIE